MASSSDDSAGLKGLGVFILLILAVALIGRCSQNDDLSTPDSPSPQAPSISTVTYTFDHLGCADGWSSPSLGRPGACSHHGGEVSIYDGSDGTQKVCGTDVCTITPAGRAASP